MIKVELMIIVRGKDGRIKRIYRQPSRSFVLAWWQTIYTQVAFVTNTSIKDTGGVSRDIDRSEYNLDCRGSAGVQTNGILVGTGDTAVATDDYNIETQILHGTGSGQLDHGAGSVWTVTDGGTSIYFQISRPFNNGSGATITIKETGIVGVIYDVGGPASYKALFVRDVLDSPVSLDDGETGTVYYTLKSLL